MKYLYPLISLVVLSSCKSGLLSAEVKEKGLLIQATSLKKSSETADLEYKVRIFHEMKNETEEEKKVREKMTYGMDSCFYKMNGQEKQYPDAVIPVANGLKNCFEYLVVFPGNLKEKSTEALTYQDKYGAGKTYQLTLK